MFCPECDSEFVDGVVTCAGCGVALVEAPPAEAGLDAAAASTEPEVVLRSGHAETVAIAKSLLMSAEIAFGVRGEEVQDLFGYGRFPAGSNLFMGPVEILVAADDAPDAVALLQVLNSSGPMLTGSDSEALVAADARTSTWGRARTVAKAIAALMIAALALELVLALARLFGLDW